MASDSISEMAIPEFFNKKRILITGGTGFMGKVLIEKLLRSCPNLETIYLIMKYKNGKDPQTRVNDLLNLPLFDLCKSQQTSTDFQSKVIALEGNVSEVQLGLSEKDYATLTEKVNIVFHVAATVRFNESLPDAVKTNTRGTSELVNLCLNMKSLQVLLHVSTAYSNCNVQGVVEETIYPSHMDWRQVIEISENIDPAILNILTEKYIGDLPNTYIFSKNLAEQVIWDKVHQLPVVIFRPSIVISSWQEPVCGWVDNINGPVGMLIAGGKGVLRAILADPDIVADYIPVDIAVKAMIAAAWHRAVLCSQESSGIIYNCTSVSKSIATQEVVDFGIDLVQDFPLSEVLWRPVVPIVTRNVTAYKIHIFFEHMLPAVLVDIVLRISGRKPMLLKLQRRIYQAVLALSYFLLKGWTFNNQNLLNLNQLILPADKEDFDFDFSNIDPKTYFRCAVFGARKFLLNDDIENIPKAKQVALRIYWFEKFLQAMAVSCVLWMINLPSWTRYFVTSFEKYQTMLIS